MNPLLSWIIPPAAGALIGYVTNALAIKMLFRPLKAIRIFGIPIPFTPGILPRQRQKLADNIGAMVERELLTPEVLRQRLGSETVRANFRAAVARHTSSLASVPLDRLAEKFASFGPFLFQRLLDSPAPDSSAGGDRSFLGGFLLSAAEEAYPALTAALLRFLERREVRGELEVQGRIFLNNAILKLNVFQRFFISAAQYDRTLHDRMPGIIDDLLHQLDDLFHEDSFRSRVLSSLDRSLSIFLTGFAAGGFQKVLEKFRRRHGDCTLGRLFAVDGETKEKIDDALTAGLLDLADREAGALLGAVDIRVLVSERINSLDMLKVERIILDVMANQLQWINVFGAILGALIGIFQALLSHFAF